MVREIMRDEAFLRIPSREAGIMDVSVADDLMETLVFHRNRCVGMAANMIGESVRIIAFVNGQTRTEMFNPQIVKTDGEFETEEGCLSLEGTRKAKRFRKITVEWQTRKFESRRAVFTGWTAQIIQHEIDHLNGIII